MENDTDQLHAEPETEEQAAWRKFVQAHVAHRGHDVKGQGSPITEIVLDHHASEYHKIYEKAFGDEE